LGGNGNENLVRGTFSGCEYNWEKVLYFTAIKPAISIFREWAKAGGGSRETRQALGEKNAGQTEKKKKKNKGRRRADALAGCAISYEKENAPGDLNQVSQRNPHLRAWSHKKQRGGARKTLYGELLS